MQTVRGSCTLRPCALRSWLSVRAGPIDGHHRRVHVLQVKIEVGTRFVDQLRARKSRLEHEERVERSRRIALADSEERRRKDELERRIRLGQAEAEHRQRLLQEQWRRDELNRSRLRQQAAAAREWQQPPQRHYPYDAYDGGGGGPSLSSMFVKAAACYCAYKLFRAFIAGRSSHSDGHNAGLAAGGGIDFNAITRWLTRQVFAVKGHFSDLWQPVKDAAAGSVGAVHGVGDWILSNIKAVGDSLSQLAPHPVESEAVVQELAREAWSVAGSAMNGAQKLAENAAGEAQKLAENAVVEAQKLAVSSAADVGKRVQEGLGSDEVKQFKQLAKSLGIRW
ncbi:hypothetical protein C8Q80DRAFT_1137092 [Daedaleopsis nitida]|nr:hypothetical protein C8Q80DRAFT_1137092 [Daedaleopsis nitida]